MKKRLKEWLADTNPEVLDRGRALINGQMVEFGHINNSRLRQVIHDHYDSGQKAMAGFVKWLIRHEGSGERYARTVAAEVWNALCVTWDAQEGASHPEELWLSSEYSPKTLDRLTGFMRRWARYTKDPILSATIDGIRARHRKSFVVQTAETHKVDPYTMAEIDALLEATEKLRGDPRWPWGWSVIRMMIVGGVRTADLLCITREQVKQSLGSGTMLIWHPKRGTRALPVQLMRDELEALLRWPWSWNGIIDIIAPRSSCPQAHVAASIGKLAEYIFGLAGVEYRGHWSYACRWAAAIRYYEITGCIVGTAHLLGTRNWHAAEAKLRVYGERQKQRDKRLGRVRRRRSVVAQEPEAEGGGHQGEVAEQSPRVGSEALQVEAADAVAAVGPAAAELPGLEQEHGDVE
jgi:hypothetical protein